MAKDKRKSTTKHKKDPGKKQKAPLSLQPCSPPNPLMLPPYPHSPHGPLPSLPLECDINSDSESDCGSEPESESEPEPVTQPPQRCCSARLAALAPAAPIGPPLPLDCEDPVMLRQLQDFSNNQAATQPVASEPGPSTPPPAKRSKRTKAEPEAAEPTKGKGKAAKAKPAPQPGRWLDRDCNAALNMQCIGESRWRPLELCYWSDQAALPAEGKEYPGLGYKRLQDKPPKAQ
ncbi:hypothetical protein QJQ45_008240 [Haematococcus lacustris]|nr:hypothetical protein QJQ45_008240 [Haematococcus lacustris]